jgi:GxxExxY protein
MNENDLSIIIVDVAFKIHTQLGPGLLESVYEKIMNFELTKRGSLVEKQKGIPVV